MAERPHFTYFNTRYVNLRLLIAQVYLTNRWQYGLAVLGTFLLALGQQALEHGYAQVDDACRRDRLVEVDGLVPWPMHAARTGLFVMRVSLSYLVMLIAISFDVGLFLALVGGASLGFFAFRRRISNPPDRYGKRGPGAL